MRSPVLLHRPGRLEYGLALRWQQERAAAVRERSGDEALALLQHPPVFTLGRRARREHMLVSAAELARRGAAVVEVGRGGDVTFHGPGQLVAYPILDLRRRELGAADYVRALEATVIEALRPFAVSGERVRGRPGVWVGEAKVAAIGVRVQRGVTSHGLALNVSTDLAWFAAIVPCGLPDATVTSLERLLGVAPPHVEVEDALAAAFERVFGSELIDAAAPLAAAPLTAPARAATARAAQPAAGLAAGGGR